MNAEGKRKDPEPVVNVRARSLALLAEAGIVLTERESAGLEIADFGLGRLADCGLQIVTYVNTDRCCAKELVLLPRQTCPEHRHPAFGDAPGKEETFRCRRGLIHLYVPGTPTARPAAAPPQGRESTYTVWHEITLRPGEQHTIPPDTKHWFQAGPDGAVVSEFSTRSRDEADVFTDPEIVRCPD